MAQLTYAEVVARPRPLVLTYNYTEGKSQYANIPAYQWSVSFPRPMHNEVPEVIERSTSSLAPTVRWAHAQNNDYTPLRNA